MSDRTGYLWIYVESPALQQVKRTIAPAPTTDQDTISRIINVAQIAYITQRDKSSIITMVGGADIVVLEHFADLLERLRNPLDDGRLEVAFLADAEG